MLTKTRIRITLALLAAIATAVPMITPAGAQSPDPGSRRAVRIENQDFEFTISQEQIAVRFDEAMTPAGRTEALAAARVTDGARVVEEIPNPRFSLVQLARTVTADQLTAGLLALRTVAGVAAAEPIYSSLGARLIATGEAFLQLEEGTDESSIAALAAQYRFEVVRKTSWRNGNWIVRPAVDAARDVIEAAAAIDADERVAYCAPDYLRLLVPMYSTNDTYFTSQWGLHSTGQAAGGVVDADVDAAEGWEIEKGSAGVVIAILDEGCAVHPDYLTKLVGGWDFPGNDDTPQPNSWDGHGTACAGIAAARTNNGLGIAGVGWNCRIMPIRIAYSNGPGQGWNTTDQWLSDAIAWAYQNGADVLSNSWGGGPPSPQIHQSIRDAVLYGRGGLGAIVCFAAGNDNNPSPSYPAIYEETICVGATSPCDERKNPGSCDGENWGSNYGLGLDVMAPGVLIPTTDIPGGGGYTPGDYTMTFNGTSSATPHVAGLAGLVVSKFPGYTEAEVRGRITQTCDRVGNTGYDAATGWSFEMGYGRVNVYRALSGKPQIRDGGGPSWPSVYTDFSDADSPYPLAKHETAAYEWLGEEYSPEVLDGDDADGPTNIPNRDGFEDGVVFHPPYIPGQLGEITVTVSVEDQHSVRYVGKNLHLNVWFDWLSDGVWDMQDDHMVRQFVISPASWGSARTQTYTLSFTVPADAIFWHTQTSLDKKFMNVRARLSYDDPVASVDAPTPGGEVEDYRFINFVEMFDPGYGNMQVDGSPCDPWTWITGPQFWLPCEPQFYPDGGANGFVTISSYDPAYAGDAFDRLHTPELDLSEMTEATLTYDMSAVELIYGRVVLYHGGAPPVTLRFYNGIPTTPPACGLIIHETIDLTPYCDDPFDDVVIAFEAFHDEPCGIPFPAYQDWMLDNVVIWAQDKISPADVVVTATPTAPSETEITWSAPGDDAMLRRAELYNLRYGPDPIDAANWRHSLWIRPDMTAIPVPGNPGTPELVHAVRLAGGFHHFAVVTLDEVTNRSGAADGGLNHPPVQTAPDTVQVAAGSTLTFDVTGTDPDFDPILLLATALPGDAEYVNHGNGTATFTWIPASGDVGWHTASFEARDPNGESDSDDTAIRVTDPPPQNGACCLVDCCSIKTSAACAADGGQFQGGGTNCSPNPCVAPRPDLADHDAGAVRLTMTDQGIIGFMNASQTQGSGFVYPIQGGSNHLYIGGLWVGRDASYIASRDYDADPTKEWTVSQCPDGRIQEAAAISSQDIHSRYADTGAGGSGALFVDQESWAWAAPASDDDFVIERILIKNQGSSGLDDLYLGLFLDLDMRVDGWDDHGSTEAGRKMVYMTDAGGVFAGLRLLDPPSTTQPYANLTLIDNSIYVWPNDFVSDADKFAFLSAGDAQHVLTNAPNDGDYTALVSIGPFDLAPGQSKLVAFAIAGGASLADLRANADRAQTVFRTGVSDVPEGTTAGFDAVSLLPNLPNPFRTSTAIRFALPEPGAARVEIYDVGGRMIRDLAEETRAAGLQTVLWDGRNTEGRPAASGIYFVRLRAAGREERRSIVLTR